MTKDFYLTRRGGVWHVRFRDPVSREILTARTSGHTNKTRAEAWARAEYDSMLSASQRPGLLLSEYADPFFLDFGCPHEARRKVDGRPFGIQTRREYRKYLERDILPDPIASLRLADIQRAHLLEFRSRVVDRRGRTRSAHMVLQVLKVILHDAIEDGVMDHDPTLRLKISQESFRERVVTDADGMKALLDPARWENPRLRLAVMTAAWVGLRAGELRALSWPDLDPDGGVIHIRRGITDLAGLKAPKWEKLRDVPYPKGLQAELEPLRGEGGEYVFAVDPSGPLSYKTLSMAMRKAAAAAGLPGLTLHGLRHSIQTLLREAGTNDELIRAAFGWSSSGTQEGYTHRKIYNLAPVGAAVESILGGRHGNDQERMGRRARLGGAVRTAGSIRRRNR